LISIQEKKRQIKNVNKELYDLEESKTRKKYATKDLKGVVKDKELEEIWVFKELPTRTKFYTFVGGCTTETWKKYEISDQFFAVVTLINNFFEVQLEM
jgi:hypothetical protein